MAGRKLQTYLQGTMPKTGSEAEEYILGLGMHLNGRELTEHAEALRPNFRNQKKNDRKTVVYYPSRSCQLSEHGFSGVVSKCEPYTTRQSKFPFPQPIWVWHNPGHILHLSSWLEDRKPKLVESEPPA